jgi:diaminopimelate epimerase
VTRIPFVKMHGAGNDFVVIDCLEGEPVEDWPAFSRRVLDRHLGVGGDQLLLVKPSREADFFMGIRNRDGSTAEMCANGIRAFFKHVRDRGYTDRDEIRVETLGGVVSPRWLGGDRVEVEMMRPILEPQKIPTTLTGDPPLTDVPIEVDGQELRATPVSMGNPHCVVFVEDPERYPVERVGPALEHHPCFPERANVEFASVRSATELDQRTWERGSGETLACGSGACATAVAAILTGRTERDVVIHLRGGDLRIRWPDARSPVWLTGPAARVFDGEIEIP